MENPIRRVVQDVWDSRGRIIQFSILTTLLAFGVSFLLPNMYRAETTILPESGQSKSSTLGGFADIAALAGVSTGETRINKLYPTILMSETILRTAVFSRFPWKQDSTDLFSLWDLEKSDPRKAFEQAVNTLRSRLDATVDYRTDVVTVTAIMESPELASEVLRKIVAAMDKFLRETRRTNAFEQRAWIEIRLKEVKEELARAENNLKTFREKNRRITDSPQLLLEQERLTRQVQINSSVYLELTKQYEIAKIEELKNIPLVNVLDPARPPTVKYQPKRTLIAGTALGISLLVAVFSVVVWKQFGVQLQAFFPSRRSSTGKRA